MVNLKDANGDPVIGAITLSAARERLSGALERLPELAGDLERGRAGSRAVELEGPPVWFLALDELGQTGMELRPRLPLPGRRASTGPSLALRGAAEPLSKIVEPLKLDPLTVSDDGDFLDRIEAQTVPPSFVRKGLRGLY